MDKHGAVEVLGDDGLVGAAEIAAPRISLPFCWSIFTASS